ncbi:MAG: thioredoxin [Thaumarchaeota archaeon]|nr:thioredoxin [Nitrososphaerota archaeon]
MSSVAKFTTSDFDSYLKSGKPVFVDFWATWCPPCRAMEPVVERLAAKYADRIVFGKLNTDEESALAMKYEIQSIPTFMIFKDGKPMDAVIGAVGEPTLERLIQKSTGPTRA